MPPAAKKLLRLLYAIKLLLGQISHIVLRMILHNQFERLTCQLGFVQSTQREAALVERLCDHITVRIRKHHLLIRVGGGPELAVSLKVLPNVKLGIVSMLGPWKRT